MARPITPEQDYLDAIKSLLDSGLLLREINATKLHQLVGGRYNRCSDILARYKAEHGTGASPITTQPAPLWFNQWVSQASNQVKQQLQSSWSVIHQEWEKTMATTLDHHTQQETLWTEQEQEYRSHIETLENQLEEQADASKKIEQQLQSSQQEFTKVSALAQIWEQELKESKVKHSDLEKTLIAAQTGKEILLERLKKAQVEYKRQFQKFTDTDQENHHLKMDNAKLTERCANQEQEIKSLNKTLNQLQGHLAGLTKSKAG